MVIPAMLKPFYIALLISSTELRTFERPFERDILHYYVYTGVSPQNEVKKLLKSCRNKAKGLLSSSILMG